MAREVSAGSVDTQKKTIATVLQKAVATTPTQADADEFESPAFKEVVKAVVAPKLPTSVSAISAYTAPKTTYVAPTPAKTTAKLPTAVSAISAYTAPAKVAAPAVVTPYVPAAKPAALPTAVSAISAYVPPVPPAVTPAPVVMPYVAPVPQGVQRAEELFVPPVAPETDIYSLVRQSQAQQLPGQVAYKPPVPLPSYQAVFEVAPLNQYARAMATLPAPTPQTTPYEQVFEGAPMNQYARAMAMLPSAPAATVPTIPKAGVYTPPTAKPVAEPEPETYADVLRNLGQRAATAVRKFLTEETGLTDLLKPQQPGATYLPGTRYPLTYAPTTTTPLQTLDTIYKTWSKVIGTPLRMESVTQAVDTAKEGLQALAEGDLKGMYAASLKLGSMTLPRVPFVSPEGPAGYGTALSRAGLQLTNILPERLLFTLDKSIDRFHETAPEYSRLIMEGPEAVTDWEELNREIEGIDSGALNPNLTPAELMQSWDIGQIGYSLMVNPQPTRFDTTKALGGIPNTTQLILTEGSREAAVQKLIENGVDVDKASKLFSVLPTEILLGTIIDLSWPAPVRGVQAPLYKAALGQYKTLYGPVIKGAEAVISKIPIVQKALQNTVSSQIEMEVRRQHDAMDEFLQQPGSPVTNLGKLMIGDKSVLRTISLKSQTALQDFVGAAAESPLFSRPDENAKDIAHIFERMFQALAPVGTDLAAASNADWVDWISRAWGAHIASTVPETMAGAATTGARMIGSYKVGNIVQNGLQLLKETWLGQPVVLIRNTIDDIVKAAALGNWMAPDIPNASARINDYTDGMHNYGMSVDKYLSEGFVKSEVGETGLVQAKQMAKVAVPGVAPADYVAYWWKENLGMPLAKLVGRKAPEATTSIAARIASGEIMPVEPTAPLGTTTWGKAWQGIKDYANLSTFAGTMMKWSGRVEELAKIGTAYKLLVKADNATKPAEAEALRAALVGTGVPEEIAKDTANKFLTQTKSAADLDALLGDLTLPTLKRVPSDFVAPPSADVADSTAFRALKAQLDELYSTGAATPEGLQTWKTTADTTVDTEINKQVSVQLKLAKIEEDARKALAERPPTTTTYDAARRSLTDALSAEAITSSEHASAMAALNNLSVGKKIGPARTATLRSTLQKAGLQYEDVAPRVVAEGVPPHITSLQRRALIVAGFSPSEIDKMTPARATQLLAVKPPEVPPALTPRGEAVPEAPTPPLEFAAKPEDRFLISTLTPAQVDEMADNLVASGAADAVVAGNFKQAWLATYKQFQRWRDAIMRDTYMRWDMDSPESRARALDSYRVAVTRGFQNDWRGRFMKLVDDLGAGASITAGVMPALATDDPIWTKIELPGTIQNQIAIKEETLMRWWANEEYKIVSRADLTRDAQRIKRAALWDDVMNRRAKIIYDVQHGLLDLTKLNELEPAVPADHPVRALQKSLFTVLGEPVEIPIGMTWTPEDTARRVELMQRVYELEMEIPALKEGSRIPNTPEWRKRIFAIVQFNPDGSFKAFKRVRSKTGELVEVGLGGRVGARGGVDEWADELGMSLNDFLREVEGTVANWQHVKTLQIEATGVTEELSQLERKYNQPPTEVLSPEQAKAELDGLLAEAKAERARMQKAAPVVPSPVAEVAPIPETAAPPAKWRYESPEQAIQEAKRLGILESIVEQRAQGKNVRGISASIWEYKPGVDPGWAHKDALVTAVLTKLGVTEGEYGVSPEWQAAYKANPNWTQEAVARAEETGVTNAPWEYEWKAGTNDWDITSDEFYSWRKNTLPGELPNDWGGRTLSPTEETLYSSTRKTDSVYRGISRAELKDILATGNIKSRGYYNFSNEEGYTLFARDPGGAATYASWFSPKGWSPRLDRPGYIIEVQRLPEFGLEADDVGNVRTVQEIPSSAITKVWEMRPKTTSSTNAVDDWVADDITDIVKRGVIPEISANPHKDIVRRALERGEAVPDKVLEEYPDLAKVVPISKPVAPPKAPGIPLFINQQMRQQLNAMGYAPADVDKMTPQQAWDILNPAKAATLAPEAPPPNTGGLDALIVDLTHAQEQFASEPVLALQTYREQMHQAIGDLHDQATKMAAENQGDLALQKAVNDGVASIRDELVKQRANNLRGKLTDAVQMTSGVLVDYGIRRNGEVMAGWYAPFYMWPLKNISAYIDVMSRMPQVGKFAQRMQQMSEEERQKLGLPPRFKNYLPIRLADGSYVGVGLIQTLISAMPAYIRWDDTMEWPDEPKNGWQKTALDIYNTLGAIGLQPWFFNEAILKIMGVTGKKPLSDVIPYTKYVRMLTDAFLDQPIDPEMWIRRLVSGAVTAVGGPELTDNIILDYYTMEMLDRWATGDDARITTEQARIAKMKGIESPLYNEARAAALKESDVIGAIRQVIPFSLKYMSKEIASIYDAQRQYFDMQAEADKETSPNKKRQMKIEAADFWEKYVSGHYETIHPDQIPMRQRESEMDKALGVLKAQYEPQIRQLELSGAPLRTIQLLQQEYDKRKSEVYDMYPDILETWGQTAKRVLETRYQQLKSEGKYDEAQALIDRLAKPELTLPGQIWEWLRWDTNPPVIGVSYDQFLSYRSRNDTPTEALMRVLRDEYAPEVWDIIEDDTADNRVKAAAKVGFDSLDKEKLIVRVLELHPEWAGDIARISAMRNWTLPTFDQMARVNDTPLEAMKGELVNSFYTLSDGSRRSVASQYKLQELWGKDYEHIFDKDNTWLSENEVWMKEKLAQVGRLDGLITEGFTELGELTGVTAEPAAIGATLKEAYAAAAASAAKAMAREKFGVDLIAQYDEVGTFYELGGKGTMPEVLKPVSAYLKEVRAKLGLGTYDEEKGGYNVSIVPSWFESGMTGKEVAEQFKGGAKITPAPVATTAKTTTAKATTTKKAYSTGKSYSSSKSYTSSKGYSSGGKSTGAAYTPKTTAGGTTPAKPYDLDTLSFEGGYAIRDALIRAWEGRGDLAEDAVAYLQDLHSKRAPEVPYEQWIDSLRVGWEPTKYEFDTSDAATYTGERLMWGEFIGRASPLLQMEFEDFFAGTDPISPQGMAVFISLEKPYAGGLTPDQWAVQLYRNWKYNKEQDGLDTGVGYTDDELAAEFNKLWESYKEASEAAGMVDIATPTVL